MKKFILLVLSAISLFSSNPKVYSTLGDAIYNDISKIENLSNIDKYKSHQFKINNYIKDVNEAKALGFAIESGQKSDEKLTYLNKLRDLMKTKEYYINLIKNSFNEAVLKNNNLLFIHSVNSGLLDIKMHKSKILSYCKLNQADMQITGTLKEFIDKEELKRINSKKNRLRYKARVKENRIKNIRELDKFKQEALEKRLSDELREKKLIIMQEQEKELQL